MGKKLIVTRSYNDGMPQFSATQQRAVETLASDLDHIFGVRLQSLVVYPGNQADGSLHSCAIVDGLGFRDLVACLPQTEGWHQRGIAVPLMLASGELERTIDIFPLEYSAILADYGIPIVETRYVASSADAADMAEEVGYPVALKAAAPELVHKTDVGGVALGLATPDAVRDAFDRMRGSLDDAMGGAFVQRMAEPGVELIAGINHDPQFGALVVFGIGGTAAELQHDTTMRIPPLTDVDLDEMLRALRGSPLLFGYRSAPPVDTVALADVLARVGSLAADIPELVELDCNPVVATPSGVVVVDVKLRLAPDAHPRRAFTLE